MNKIEMRIETGNVEKYLKGKGTHIDTAQKIVVIMRGAMNVDEDTNIQEGC
jgi:hypothetical protein